MKRALISVSDKTGIEDLAIRLSRAGFQIISTGGTAAALRKAGVPVTGIPDVTGFPEILDGRVKTLHPAVHGALLARRDVPEHMDALASHGITPIDMVVVNLYPFRQTVTRPGVTLEDAVENIDIGGPSMIRSAAKNFRDVVVLTDPARYEEVLKHIDAGQEVPPEVRFSLAADAFRHTASYDALISDYFGRLLPSWPVFTHDLVLRFEKAQELRYGENPHQQAALYTDPLFAGPAVVNAEKLWGKELSYNNISDADAALSLALEFEDPTAVVVKHATPCGVGTGRTISEAYQRAYDADPVSIFGGIVAMNCQVPRDVAEAMSKIFLEIILAPAYDEDALEVLKRKKNVRILRYAPGPLPRTLQYKHVMGGLLVQEIDALPLSAEDWKTVTEREPTAREIADMRFGWRVVKYVKSNAILLAKDGMTLGVGTGQTNRIDSARIAIKHAGEKAKGAVLVSDGMFPFSDVVEEAAAAGVTAIVQPGGSIKDEDSIAAANSAGVAMVFTGARHFRH